MFAPGTTIYSANANDKREAQLFEYGEIHRVENGLLYVTEKKTGKTYKIPDDKLYTCSDIATRYMFGTDKDMLIKAWNKAVKRHVRKLLEEYDNCLIQVEKEDLDAPAQAETVGPPAESITQADAVLAQSADTELRDSEQAKGERTSDSSAIPEENAPAQGDIFPRAIEVDWPKLDMMLCVWVAQNFPEESRVIAHADIEAAVDPAWYIRLERVTETDLPYLEAALKRLGAENEPLEPDGPEQFILDNKIANSIMGIDILPFQKPSFPYGVNRAFPTSNNDIVFVSDYF